MILDFHYDSKYKQVARWLESERGTLLDIGARDRILRKHLRNPADFVYSSADASAGCDHQVDLEKPLAFADGQFDHVVALDVLEHVERVHEAFAELVRISARSIIIALPNMGGLPRRFRFLFGGNLGTDKYSLPASHPGDRHRWLTVYPEIMAFYQAMASRHGLDLERVANEALVGLMRPMAVGFQLVRTPLGGLMSERVTALFRKRKG